MIDNFSYFRWRAPLQNKKTQSIKDSFENFLITSKNKLNLTETDRDSKFYNNIFQNFLNKNNNKIYSRNTSLGTVFAERFNRTSRYLLERPIFREGDDNWIDISPTINNQ